MADNVLTVSIVTPDGIAYERKDAHLVVLNTDDGQMGIMHDHVPVIASLKVDEVRVRHGDNIDKVAVNGGFVEFSHDEATIIADSAEKQSDIDVDRADRARKRAQAAIEKAKENHDKVTLKRNQVALERAINRIHVAKH